MFKLISTVALSVLLCACGGGGGSSSSAVSGGSSPNTYTAASGVAQKGPLLKGSTVTAQELDASLSPTGKQYMYPVNSDLGTFSPTSTFGSRYIGLTATGYYYDEVQGAVSGGTITLNGVSDLGSSSVLNVNLLTTLAYQRIAHLVTVSHLSVPAATIQAENEVLMALNIPNGRHFGGFGALDLSQGSDGDKILAAVSSLFVYGNSSGQLSSLVANFQSDIANNGVIDSSTTKAALVASGKALNPSVVASNLTSEYSSLGMSYSASDISNWIDSQGDGVVGKFRFQALAGIQGTSFSIPASDVDALTGSSISLSSGQLLVNGTAVAGATLKAGDTVSVSAPVGASSIYMLSGATKVAQLSLQPALALLAGSAGGDGALDGIGSNASFFFPSATAVDSAGNIYVADTFNSTIRKITPAGVVTTLAGTAYQPYGACQSADGTASAARFCRPYGVAVDGNGNVFVADSENSTIRKITPAGVVSTLAGTAYALSTCQFADGLGSVARFCAPYGIAVDAAGSLYVADKGNNAIRKISAAGAVSTLANGVASGVVTAYLNTSGLSGLAVDGGGSVFVADSGNSVILKVTATGVKSTLAGQSGIAGTTDAAGSSARFTNPMGLSIDASGNVYVADMGNSTIRKVTSAGVVSTLAGSADVEGSNDGTGTSARFGAPRGVAVDGSGTVFVADSNDSIRKITASGMVTTLAGTASQFGSADGTGAAALFDKPYGPAVDASGNVYVADTGNSTIRKTTPAGVVSTFAGTAYAFNGTCQSANGSGSAARFCLPDGVAVDGSGNVYVADNGNGSIRKITPAGVVTTLASGAFTIGSGLAVDAGGNVYTGDSVGIRKISPVGVVSTLATGVQGSGIAVNSAGIVYVAQSSRIIQISAVGSVSVLAGTSGVTGSADGSGTAAQFNGASGLAVDSGGNVLVDDVGNYTIRKITPAGAVSTVVGVACSFGTLLGALPGSLSSTHGIALTPDGRLVIASNNAVLTTTLTGF